jgi:two-component system nitrogen regulation sensor histidine kinase NtrY
VSAASLIAVMPELAPLFEQAADAPTALPRARSKIVQGGTRRILLVRISAASDAGPVVTFDDVTDLMSAQRMAAWGDVARRIAHEIKNPLTPIQLSAERLKRRYLQADQGGSRDLLDLHRHHHPPGRRHRPHGRRVLVLRPHAAADGAAGGRQGALPAGAVPAAQAAIRTSATSRLPDQAVPLICDRRAGRQVLTNILKNSAEAIEGREAHPARPCRRARFTLTLRDDDQSVRIVVDDNGKGPAQGRPRAADRALYDDAQQGTGLGLAIVKKIMEDHGGYLAATTARVAARASVWYSGATRRKSRRSPHCDGAQ